MKNAKTREVVRRLGDDDEKGRDAAYEELERRYFDVPEG